MPDHNNENVDNESVDDKKKHPDSRKFFCNWRINQEMWS